MPRQDGFPPPPRTSISSYYLYDNGFPESDVFDYERDVREGVENFEGNGERKAGAEDEDEKNSAACGVFLCQTSRLARSLGAPSAYPMFPLFA